MIKNINNSCIFFYHFNKNVAVNKLIMMSHFYMYGRTKRQENLIISLFGNQFRSSSCEDPEKWG